MVFSSYIFIFLFLPITLLVYYALPFRIRMVWIGITSYIFFGWFEPVYCLLMLFVSAWNYYCGRFIARSEEDATRKFWVFMAVAVSIGFLAYYKYAGMLTHWADQIARVFIATPDGTNIVPVLKIVLPIGISFFTFQALSYPIDVYRRDAREAKDILAFISYIALFPQLVAGPIVRYQWIADELIHRTHTPAKFSLGLRFFAIGMAKKVMLADLFALAVPAAFGEHQPSFEMAWVGVLGYSLQIYFDFSAYSDMAVGLGLMMGFTFPQNFDSPYKSGSITEFWRRWHITLSTWLRDYLYIPLGGNRIGNARTYANLTMVMLLGGMWHGASIVFVLWGLWHGVLLALERALGKSHPLRWLPRPISVALTHLLVLLGWVLFRSVDFAMAGRVLNGMFYTLPSIHLSNDFVSLGVIAAIPVGYLICLFAKNSWEMSDRITVALALRDSALLTASVIVVMANRTTPFLYFQF